MSLVLNTGVYPPLLETRRLLLEHAGHVVMTKVEGWEIVEACQQYQFDVVVIGQSASASVKKHIFRLVRQHCKSAKVLELTEPYSEPILEGADSWLEIFPLRAGDLSARVTSLAGD